MIAPDSYVRNKCRDEHIIGSNPTRGTDVCTTSRCVFRDTSVPSILPDADINADIFTNNNGSRILCVTEFYDIIRLFTDSVTDTHHVVVLSMWLIISTTFS
ncbi:hypothetical protein Gogos_019367 [Gossypium gossypioides]|uniref:Uncharacterized protein n=1 Tax=Gossypium gossypioides TaxID=34282 RepID=A0A7J9BH66_GOSGO|nr:hypothetical protein [Gossypium gossypioides]